MKRPMNRMEVSETQELGEQPKHAEPGPGRCPSCGGASVIVSERVHNNRVIIRRRCEGCGDMFSE